MSELENVLRELESATAAVATVPVEDFAEAQAAMARRAWAIADLAMLAARGIPEPELENALRRLRRASEAGEKAAKRLVSIRSAAAVEWSHWSRIHRSLGTAEPAGSTLVDCSG